MSVLVTKIDQGNIKYDSYWESNVDSYIYGNWFFYFAEKIAVVFGWQGCAILVEIYIALNLINQ